MALSDYRLCSVCNRKTYYDANLDWESEGDWPPNLPANCYALEALCSECVHTHEIVVREKPAEPDQGFADPRAIRAGDFDHVENPHLDERILVGLSEAHRLAWKTARRRSHTSHDAKVLKTMLKPVALKGEGRLPSEVAKAVLGMTMERRKGDFDRAQYKDWAHVRRRFDYWLELFADYERNRSHRETQGAQPDDAAAVPDWVRETQGVTP